MLLGINRFNPFLPRRLMQISLLGLLFTVMMPSHANRQEDDMFNEAVFDQLLDLSLEDLGEVEVTLSDVFDIFNAFVYTKEVKLATGAWQSTASAPSVTTVITSQDIEATGATDLDEVLEMVPGLHVAKNYVGYNPIYTIRGIYSAYNPEVLVLINGISIKTAFSGDRSLVWGGMPLNAIDRIEIIRGPGSAVYGADAFAGVINIITKTRETIDGTEIGARVGSFDTQEAWALHGAELGGFDMAFALEYRNTDGQREIIDSDGQTELDQRDGTHASTAPGPVDLSGRNLDARLDISKGSWQLRAGYQGRRDYGSGAGGTQILDPGKSLSDDRVNADLTYHNQELTDYWDVTAQLSYFHSNLKAPNQILFPPGNALFPDGFRFEAGWAERNTRVELSGFYSGFNNHLFRVGIGYHYADLYKFEQRQNLGAPPGKLIDLSDAPLAAALETDRNNWHIFIQDAWRFMPKWELTAGVRYDEYSDFGKTTNPRLALVWQTRPNLTTKLLYGQAFLAPSFNQINNDNNPIALGNPNLGPETIETWELAFDYRATDDLNLALNLFNYDITDKILFLPEPGGSYRAQNAGRQKGEGGEFEVRWKMTKKSSLLFNYAFQNSIDKNNDHEVGNAPQHQAYLRTDWLVFPNWFLDTQVNWIGERGRAFGDPRENLDDYTTLDLTLRRKNLKEPWNFAVSVRNLFDEDAREPTPGPDISGIINIYNDLPLAGRNYWLELRYRF